MEKYSEEYIFVCSKKDSDNQNHQNVNQFHEKKIFAIFSGKLSDFGNNAKKYEIMDQIETSVQVLL